MTTKYTIIIAVISLFLISGCAKAKYSQKLHTSDEVGIAKKVFRCRVLAVEEITIREEGKDETGVVTGAIVGASIGSELAKNSEFGGLAGAIIGGVLGDQIGEAASRRKGLAYSILVLYPNGRDEEITFTQEYSPKSGDVIIQPGQTCRLTQSSDGINRILPITGLEKNVDKPEQSKFND